MHFFGTFVTAKIDVEQYKKKLELHLRKQLREAARAWLLGASGKVPIWSGMAMASLGELMDYSGEKIIIVPKGGVKSRIPEGRLLGSTKENTDFNDFSITIISKVPHYLLQEYEYVGVSKTAPWRSLIAGIDAAEPIMTKATLPAPTIKSKIIKVK